jgi:cytochrome c biogenesis protein
MSMRTALVLLFLLAIAAVPGSLLPQRPLNPAKVQVYLDSHGGWGRFLDSIGGFDVFGSFWFVAIYLLLFASLIGCLIPRITVHAKALRAKPLKAPKHLSRMVESARFDSDLGPEAAAAKCVNNLRPRWRTIVRTEESGAVTVSAEKGYSRETGNLVFHVALLAALALIAAGRMFSYEGNVVVTEGSGFCNAVLSYDSWRAGSAVDTGKTAPFCVDRLNSFKASYREDGSPAQFKADVNYSLGLDGASRHQAITVNHPLRVGGDRIYLLNHGFSPTVTVRQPNGRTQTQTAAFLPQDGNLTSEGAFKIQGPGAGTDIGVRGLFAPTAMETAAKVVTSSSPMARDPVLAIFAFSGDLGLSDGQPQSVYQLKQSQIDSGKLKKVAAKNLRIGQTMTLPRGATITFDGYRQWATMQVSHDPTQAYLLIAAVLMIAGLLGSLAVRRRRLWLRLSIAEQGTRTLVEMGGLARNDSGNFTEEFAAIVERLLTALRVETTPVSAVPVGAGKD